MTTKASLIDLNGNEMILDADGDTSITADTDDQIDFKTGGSDRVSIDGSGQLSVTSSSGIAAEFLGESGPHGLRVYGNDGGFGSIGHVSSGSYDIKIDSAGIVTQPSQPAFGARVNSSISGFNPSSLTTVVVFNLEFETDRNSDYNTSTGLFTAPVDGIYWFQASIYSNYTFQQGWLVVNSARHNFADVVYGSAYGIFAATYYAELDANDTVGFHPYKSGETSVLIYDNNHHTYFRGGLLY